MNRYILTLLLLGMQTSYASDTSKAYRLYSRLNGITPTKARLDEMKSMIAVKNPKGAALKAMEDKHFYNTFLKNWFKSWSNVERTARVPLNDYVATAIGIIKDDIPFDQVLYGDHLYIGSTTTVTLTPYSKTDNKHYEEIDRNQLSLKDTLVKVSQSQTTGISDTAGVLTTRAAGSAFFSAGTNRRMTRFTFMNFLCRDFEAVHDVNVPDYHVRRDVERNPGGDSRVYKSQCVGCHAGQDALGGAFAYFDFNNNELKYTPGVVVAKINKNNKYSEGWVTADDSFENLWAEGQNANLGWPEVRSGNGARQFGMMISRSRAFSECMAFRAYEAVCFHRPNTTFERSEIKRLADLFQQNENYNMKNLIAETAISCLGE